MINAANGHINTIRQETIAINLARESMEGMYNRRNTNRLRHPAEKDKHRLCTNNICNGFLSSGWTYYVLQSGWNSFLPKGAVSSIRGKTWFLLKDSDFIGDKPGWSFYRAVIPLWLYQKDVNISWWNLITECISASHKYTKLNFDGTPIVVSVSCGDDTPKEFRFCSRVEYEGLWNGNVELCGAITNYQE